MSVSKFLGLAAVAAAITAVAAPAGAYERDYNRGSTYNQRGAQAVPTIPRHSDTVVVTPRSSSKVVIIARDHDDYGWHHRRHHKFWKRWHRWEDSHGRGPSHWR